MSVAVSIVVPVYNAAGHLETLLADLARQGDGVELVLVDDGSTDGSAERLDAFAATHRSARVLHQPNGGPARARNAGVAAASGAVIAFCDADDRVAPQFAATIASHMRDRSLDILHWNARRMAGSAPAFTTRAVAGAPVSGREWLVACVARGEFRHVPWVQAWRAALAKRIAFPDGIVHEDIVWTCEGLLEAHRVGFVDEVLYEYRATPGSLMRDTDPAAREHRIASYFEVVARLRAMAERAGLAPEVREALLRQAAIEAGHLVQLARRLPDRARRLAAYRRAGEAGLPALLARHARGLKEHWRARRAAVLVVAARTFAPHAS